MVQPARYRSHEYLVVGLILLVTMGVLHGMALEGYWRFDDGAHLTFAIKYSPGEYFLLPDITAAQSGLNITPWNALFYDVGLGLFGFAPIGFYLLQLTVIFCCAVLIYLLLRMRVSMRAAAVAALLFLLGKPTIHLAQMLMNGHYALGLFFSLISVFGFIRYFDSDAGGGKWLLVSVCCYALAASCKELYVPLPGLLLFLAVGSFSKRLKAVMPFFVVGLLYALWRQAVLGYWVSGQQVSQGSDLPSRLWDTIKLLPEILLTPGYLGMMAWIVWLAMVLAYSIRNKRILPAVIAGMAVLIAPILPLSSLAAERFHIAIWAATCVLTALAWEDWIRSGKLWIRLSGLAFAPLLLATAWQAHAQEWNRMSPSFAQNDRVHDFFLRMRPREDLLLIEKVFFNEPSYLAASANALWRARMLWTHSESPPPVISTFLPCAGVMIADIINSHGIPMEGLQVFMEDGDRVESLRVPDFQARVHDVLAETLKHLRSDQDFDIVLRHGDPSPFLEWNVTTRADELYYVLHSQDHYSCGPIPQRQGRTVFIPIDSKLRILGRSRRNDLLVSPYLCVGREVEWMGKTDPAIENKLLDALLFVNSL